MPCNPRCKLAKVQGGKGSRPTMVSISDTGRFPFGVFHEACDDCVSASSLGRLSDQELFNTLAALKTKK